MKIKGPAFRQIEPQPARGVLHEGLWTDPQWVAEEKYDGDRRIMQMVDKLARFTGRKKSVKDHKFVEKSENVPHLRMYPENLEGTVLDGEMIFTGKTDGGGRSKYVTSIMGSLPAEAIAKQKERGWLTYVVFDCLWWKGDTIMDLPYNERRAYAKCAVDTIGNKYMALAEQSTLKRKFYDRIIKQGGEGIILKNVWAAYGDRRMWVKVKAQATADVVIMGFKDAKALSTKKGDSSPTATKYAMSGLIGAVVCGQLEDWDDGVDGPGAATPRMREVATVSGMTDELRASFTKYPDKYVGKVITIEHNGREPTGRFRHPRLADNSDPFRTDKTAKDCVIDLGES